MIRTLKAPADAETKKDLFDPSKLAAITTWAGAGFTALAAALTFIGTTGGYLQRILGEHPVPSLWIFVMIGLGVVASLFAGATKSTYPVYSAWILVVLTIIGGLSARFYDDFGVRGFGKTSLGLVLVAVVFLFLVLLVRESTVPVPAGLLVIAVAATSMGLYGAMKLSVGSRAEPEPFQTRAELVKSHGRDAVKVALAGSQQAESTGTVAVYIIGKTKDKTGAYPSRKAGWAYFHPDTANKVKESFTFPVSLAGARSISVRSCMGSRCKLTETWRVKVVSSK